MHIFLFSKEQKNMPSYHFRESGEKQMRPSFLKLPRPIVTCILCEKTVERAVATIKNAEFDGAPAFAIHLEPWTVDMLNDENFRRVAQASTKPIMFLRYRGTEKWPLPLSDEERVEMLMRTVECGAACVDFTADTFDPSPLEFTQKPEAVDQQKRAIDRVHQMGAEVVMSSHIYEPRTCEQVLEHMKAVESRGPDFAKIVTMANTEEEFTEAIRTTLALRKEMKVPFIHLVGGRFALPHRYLSPSLGNSLTFCVHQYTDDYVTVQPPMKNMVSILNNYNWHIDR